MSSKFEQCKSTGKIERVSAGEVCSLSVAKALGIDNIKNNQYFIRGYANVKIFNENVDSLKTNVSAEICSLNDSQTKAYPLCPLQEGAGFGFTEQYVPSIDSYACVTSECPTSFKPYVNKEGGQDPLKCVKPKQSKTSPLGKQNDERWYDWFTIPDYHIGNRYNTSNNVNYRPCDKGSVPLYTTDPVDGLSIGFQESYDRLDRCVSKGDYFGGKYADGPSYCPMAWILRAGATKRDYIEMYNDVLTKVEETGKATSSLDALRSSIPSLVEKEINDPIQKEGYSFFIGPPLTEEDENACNTMMRDADRVNQTYSICKRIKDDPEGFKKRIEVDVIEAARGKKDVTKDMIASKVMTRFDRTRQACHAVFCDPDGPGMAQAEAGETICYKDAETANLDKEIKAAEEKEKEASREKPPITSDKEKETAKRAATKGVLEMAKTLLFILGILFFYYKVWPFLKKLYETQIKPLFSRHAKTGPLLDAEEAAKDSISLFKAPTADISSNTPGKGAFTKSKGK